MGTVLSKMASGATWSIAIRLFDRMLGLVSTLILARLLTPTDFGLVAMGTSILAILNAATEFGFTLALLQRRSDDKPAYDTAWTLNVLTGLGIAAVLVASIPLVIRFYDDPAVTLVLAALAISAAIAGARNVWIIEFERNMNFRPLFMLSVTKKVAMVVVTLTCAIWLQDYRALLAGIVTGSLVEVGVSFIIRRERPRCLLSQTGSLFDFSKWWILNQVTQMTGRRGQDMLVGRFLGAKELGAFSVAYELATLPTSELVAPIMRAAFPGYMHLRQDSNRLREGFLRVWSMVALIVIPAAIGMSAVAEGIAGVILGPKWTGVAPLLAMLALLGGLEALRFCFWPVVLASRGPKTCFALTLANVVVALPIFGVLLHSMGMNAAVWSVLATTGSFVVLWALLTCRLLSCGLRTLLGPVARPAIATAAMWFVLTLLGSQGWSGPSTLANLVGLVLTCLGGAAVYSLAVYCLWRLARRPDGAEGDILRTIESRRTRRK